MPKQLEKPLKILHLSTAKTWRGGEQQIAYLLGELARLGISQLVFCPSGSVLAAYCQQAGIAVVTFNKTFNLDPYKAYRIKRICGRNGISHLHAHDSPAHTFAVLSAALFGNRLPLVVHRRVDFPIGNNWFSKWKYNHPAVLKIICVSKFIEALIRPVVRHAEKLTTVYSGIDLSRFEKTDNPSMGNDLRQTFHIPSRHFLIANIAAIAPHKDYQTFVRTAEILLRNEFPATFLAFGGDGGEMDDIRQLIHEKGLEKRVLLAGFRNDIEQVLPQIDLLLFTSKTEGLGTSLLDAFATGKPVVATAAGGVPELVEHGITGLLCPVGDAAALANAVIELLNDNGLEKRLTEKARKKVQGFTKEKMASAILAVYRIC